MTVEFICVNWVYEPTNTDYMSSGNVRKETRLFRANSLDTVPDIGESIAFDDKEYNVIERHIDYWPGLHGSITEHVKIFLTRKGP